MSYIISGIQQVGIGVKDVYEAWAWYRRVLGFNVPVFDEAAVANLMLPYTGGTPKTRHAVLALNMQGGGGMEIWQHKDLEPRPPQLPVQLGDLGIYAVKIKCLNIQKAYNHCQINEVNFLSEIVKAPDLMPYFWIKDPYDNLFQIIESKNVFNKNGSPTGGIGGVILGTSHINETTQLFKDILKYDYTVYDKIDVFPDFKDIPGGKFPCNRVLLTHALPRTGAFSRLLGTTDIELIQVFDRKPEKIFANRYWGELGFIHLCFDVNGMESLKYALSTEGYPFTVDSANSFDMGEAAGRFSYIEDKDGALLEFVETHKVPILKKLGWYLHLKNRPPEKPLPDWMIWALGLNKVS
jgi:catechol 2,3-dioxygenase-like lactoylglutathione lyase family enzyme